MELNIHRRLVIAISAGLASGLTSPINFAQAPIDTTLSPEDWLSAWSSIHKSVSGALVIGRFKDPTYFLTQPISWKQEGAVNPMEVTVPKGFVTDFASIPRIFWSVLRPDGDYAYAAVIHDYLYWFQPPSISRQNADDIFLSAMDDFKIEPPTARLIHQAVRTGGQSAWDSNKALRESGEKRILTRFPQDPRITWLEWKVNVSVFESI